MIVTINRTCRNHMNEEHSTHLRDVMSTATIQCHMSTATAHIKQLNKVCGLRVQLVHSGLGVQLVHKTRWVQEIWSYSSMREWHWK